MKNSKSSAEFLARRRLLQTTWSVPVISMITLPAHAQTSAPTATTGAPPATTSVPSASCSNNVCSTVEMASDGEIGGLVFDATSCSLIFDNGPAAALLADPDMIFFGDNNSVGTVISNAGGTNWTIDGLSLPDQVLGPIGSATESRTFQATNTQTNERFEVCLTITRVGDAAQNVQNITYSVEIGAL